VVEELVKKAGFETDREKLKDLGVKQLTKNFRKIHGRGGTYEADVIGLYSLPIPFTYPMLLVGEAKYQKDEVKIGQARQFLGIYTDISQYPRINTKSKQLKYSEMFKETRFNYVPVMFSANGFQKNAQALLYAHGIYFISYENSPIFGAIKKHLESLLKQIDISKVQDQDMSIMYKAKSIAEIKNIGAQAKRPGFDKAIAKLLELEKNTNSYIAMLDNTLMLHILSKTRLRRPSQNVIECHPELIKDNFIQLRYSAKKRSRKIGGFSMPSQFLEQYVKNAIKQQKPVFEELVIYKNHEGKLFPIYLKFSEEGRNNIINTVIQMHQKANTVKT